MTNMINQRWTCPAPILGDVSTSIRCIRYTIVEYSTALIGWEWQHSNRYLSHLWELGISISPSPRYPEDRNRGGRRFLDNNNQGSAMNKRWGKASLADILFQELFSNRTTSSKQRKPLKQVTDHSNRWQTTETAVQTGKSALERLLDQKLSEFTAKPEKVL